MEETKRSRLAAIMFTDIVEYSRKMGENEDHTLTLLDKHNEIVYPIIDEWDGHIIKTIGDALMVDFDSAVNAVRCSIDIQKAFSIYNKHKEEKDTIYLRIGVHLGDIWFLDNDAFGEGVNIAARLYPLAEPGCICISQDVFNMVVNKISNTFERLGPVDLKNINKTVEVYHIIVDNTKYNSSNVKKASRNAMAVSEKKKDNGFNLEVLLERLNTEPKQVFEDVKDWVQSYIPEIKKPNIEKALMEELDKSEQPLSLSELCNRHSIKPVTLKRLMKKHIKKGYLFKEERNGETYYQLFNMEVFKKDIEEKLAKEKKELREHSIAYGVINTGLMLLNLLVSGADYLWFLYPLAGWGIGLANHIGAFFLNKKFYKKILSYRTMNYKLYNAIMKYRKEKQDIIGHVISYMTVIPFLAGINIFNNIDHLWFLYPAGGWGFGLIMHLSTYFSKKDKLQQEVSGLEYLHAPQKMLGKDMPGDKPLITPFCEIIEEVHKLHNELEKMVGEVKSLDDNWKEEMTVLMSSYIKDMENLAAKASFVKSVIISFSKEELDVTKKELVFNMDRTKDTVLQKEYKASIDSIEKQMNSIGKLNNQLEKLHVKLNNSLISFKQLKIEIARVESVTTKGFIDPINSLREKSQELSDYFDILDKEIAEL